MSRADLDPELLVLELLLSCGGTFVLLDRALGLQKGADLNSAFKELVALSRMWAVELQGDWAVGVGNYPNLQGPQRGSDKL
jgi:hypothetical protein